LAVIVAATVLIGYSIPPPSFDMLRALVVIPPLLLLAGWTGLRCLRDWAAPRTSRAMLGVLGVLILVQVAWNLAALDREYRPTLHAIVLADMVDQGRRPGIIECVNPALFCLSLSSSWGRS
jgi:hypothetical protein